MTLVTTAMVCWGLLRRLACTVALLAAVRWWNLEPVAWEEGRREEGAEGTAWTS